MFNLEQLVNVTNWISNFDPQNINYVDLSLPGNLRKLDDFSKVAVKDYPKQNRVIDIARESIENLSSAGGTNTSFALQAKALAEQQMFKTFSNNRRRDRFISSSYQGAPLSNMNDKQLGGAYATQTPLVNQSMRYHDQP